MLGAIESGALVGLNVKQPNRVHFQVRVTCVDVGPGTYRQDVDAVLRQTVVGRARLNVTCIKAAAQAPPRPVQALGTSGEPPAPPPGQPPVSIVAPVAPLPAAQPQAQVQPQVQVQVQPLTAAAIQEQQELQLALALNGVLKDDDPVFANSQLAMVDRRRREEVQALGVLAFAMVACAGMGLARLRAKPETQFRTARAHR